MTDVSCHRCAGLERRIDHLERELAVRPPAPQDLDPDIELTARELEVLVGLAEGRTNRAIADDLYLSIETVRSHVRTAFRKIGVHNRTEAAIWYLRNAAA